MNPPLNLGSLLKSQLTLVTICSLLMPTRIIVWKWNSLLRMMNKRVIASCTNQRQPHSLISRLARIRTDPREHILKKLSWPSKNTCFSSSLKFSFQRVASTNRCSLKACDELHWQISQLQCSKSKWMYPLNPRFSSLIRTENLETYAISIWKWTSLLFFQPTWHKRVLGSCK